MAHLTAEKERPYMLAAQTKLNQPFTYVDGEASDDVAKEANKENYQPHLAAAEIGELSVLKTSTITPLIYPDGRMARKDAAAYLGYKPGTLAMLATEGKGPKRVKLGGRVFYFKHDLDAWVHAHYVSGGGNAK